MFVLQNIIRKELATNDGGNALLFNDKEQARAHFEKQTGYAWELYGDTLHPTVNFYHPFKFIAVESL